MSESKITPLDPVLLPDLSGSEGSKRKLASVSVIAKTRARHGKNERGNRKQPRPAKYSIEDAFNYFNAPYGSDRGEGEFQNERCVRSVAYLLHYLSNYGNSDVDGSAVTGLGRALEACAEEMARAVGRQEWLREMGGKS
jgi:hypothetical protein